MAMHNLKSAIFFAVGHGASEGRSALRNPRTERYPSGLAIGLAVGVFAISGLPPFGVFMSEFLILTTTFARAPRHAIFPALGSWPSVHCVALAGPAVWRTNGTPHKG
jgi:hydrogenase-4 component F